MTEHRCPAEHPRRPGQLCGALLFRGDFDGEIVVVCWRCHRIVTVDMRSMLTTA